MRVTGQWYEVDGMDEPTCDIQDAIVTKDRIALDWEENGDMFHALLHSTDGGYNYQGHFGERLLDTNCVIEAWRFRSVAGDELLWVTWHRKDTGFGGTSLVHLGGRE